MVKRRVLTAIGRIATLLSVGIVSTSCGPGQQPPTGRPSQQPLVACDLTRALLPLTGLEGYVVNVDQRMTSEPFKGMNPLPGYSDGRERGFLTKLALQQPWRSQEDSLSRVLGYGVGRWPLVPLQGSVVADHRAQVLELYEVLLSWTTTANAEQWNRMVQQPIIQANENSIDPSPLPVGFVVRSSHLGGSDANHELAFRIQGAVGPVTVQLGVQGGVDVQLGTVQSYSMEAIQRVQDVCGA